MPKPKAKPAPPALTPGEIARAKRLELGWSQAEAAKRAGISQSTLSGFERGSTDELSRGSIVVLATALGLHPGLLDPWWNEPGRFAALPDHHFGTCSKCGQPLPFPDVE